MVDKLTDKEAKQTLLKWPARTKQLWTAPGGSGFWIRAQPTDGKAKYPTLASPGAKLFTTQPDGLWVHFNDYVCCDLIAIEVCGTVQNLNDKRSRYIPASHSLVLKYSRKWLEETVSVQKGGKKARWEAAASLGNSPQSDGEIPIRYLRVLYALPQNEYHEWCAVHTPTGYEFFLSHNSLKSYNSPKFQEFLRQMSPASKFYTTPRPKS
ncbi:MAG: hypothetical protein WAM71_17120 [Candidatus Korobacteraceae bacterium]